MAGYSAGLDYSNPINSTYQKLYGRNATPQEIMAATPYFDDPYGGGMARGTQYVQGLFNQDQAKTQAPIQEADQLKQQGDLISQVLQKQRGATMADLSPGGASFDKMAGSFNNTGLLNSGAFSQGLGQAYGQQEGQLESAALGQTAFPTISGFSNMETMPLQQQFQLPAELQKHNMDYTDFLSQSNLAGSLADKEGGGSTFSKILMGVNSGANAANAGANAKTATSYICLEMIKRGLLCPWDLDELHLHVMPAVFKKGRAFWLYATRGRQLVEAANNAGIDWKEYRPLFYDRVVAQSDKIKAVELYALAFKQLALRVAPHLWDERAMRTGIMDSLPFLPRLAVFPPYLRALRKVFRMKSMLLLDRGYCGGHS